MQRTNYLKRMPSLFLYLLVYYLIIGSDSIIFSYNRNQAVVAYGQYAMVALALLFFGISLINRKAFRKKNHSFPGGSIVVAGVFCGVLYGILGRLHFDYSFVPAGCQLL